MARIVYTLGELAGSIGGLTFQRNRSGTIVRTRPTVSKSSTSKQQAAHQTQQHLLYLYQGLSNEQKAEWDSYAMAWTKENKYGQTKTLTGQNWFTSVNYFRELLSSSILNLPPAHLLPDSTPTFEILITADQIKIFFTQAHDFTESPIVIWVSPPIRQTSISINRFRKYCTLITSDTPNPVDITTVWETATGLTWAPVDNFPSGNIFVCLQAVRATSGISGPLSCAKINTSEITNEEEVINYFI